MKACEDLMISRTLMLHVASLQHAARVKLHTFTVPRLELCAAVEAAVEVAESIQRNLDHPLDN